MEHCYFQVRKTKVGENASCWTKICAFHPHVPGLPRCYTVKMSSALFCSHKSHFISSSLPWGLDLQGREGAALSQGWNIDTGILLWGNKNKVCHVWGGLCFPPLHGSSACGHFSPARWVCTDDGTAQDDCEEQTHKMCWTSRPGPQCLWLLRFCDLDSVSIGKWRQRVSTLDPEVCAWDLWWIPEKDAGSVWSPFQGPTEIHLITHFYIFIYNWGLRASFRRCVNTHSEDRVVLLEGWTQVIGTGYMGPPGDLVVLGPTEKAWTEEVNTSHSILGLISFRVERFI